MFAPVYKAIAGAVVAFVVQWLSSKGFAVPPDVAGWLTSTAEALLAAAGGFAVVWFMPKNAEPAKAKGAAK